MSKKIYSILITPHMRLFNFIKGKEKYSRFKSIHLHVVTACILLMFVHLFISIFAYMLGIDYPLISDDGVVGFVSAFVMLVVFIVLVKIVFFIG